MSTSAGGRSGRPQRWTRSTARAAAATGAAPVAAPAVPPVAAPATPPPILPPPFALTPAHAIAGILDYTTDGGRATYDAMTKQVQPKNERYSVAKKRVSFSFW